MHPRSPQWEQTVFSRLKWPLLLGILLLGGWRLRAALPCVPAWLRWGLVLESCPEGTPVPLLSLEAEGLRRGETGEVRVALAAAWTAGGPLQVRRAPLPRFTPALSLVDDQEMETALQPTTPWETIQKGTKSATLTLPGLPDGDYRLRVRVDTPLGPVETEAPLSFYKPALVHLITDRPLYKPGQRIQFRAVTWDGLDLAPLEQRPGRFKVTSPQGALLLDEPARSGDFGVSASDLPLPDDAEEGTYRIAYSTGDARDEVSVRVEPFTLPRLTLEARADQPWYEAGENPTVRGAVRYRSGAPVAGARVELKLERTSWGEEAWPPPTDWLATRTSTADANGHFNFQYSPVPEDLAGLTTLSATLSAADSSGERIGGSTVLRFSANPVVAQVETELSSGLVADFNNRLYVRVTLPDGTPLPGAQVSVSPAWDPAADPVQAVADEDAVAALQMDPGAPVSVIIPAPPVRAPTHAQDGQVSLEDLEDLFTRATPSLDEQVLIERWEPALQACAWWAEDQQTDVTTLAAVGAAGRVARVQHDDDPLGRCLASALTGLPAPPGAHLYSIQWRVRRATGPTLVLQRQTGVPFLPDGLDPVLADARQGARHCLAGVDLAGPLPDILHWRVAPNDPRVAVDWVRDPAVKTAWPEQTLACIRTAFQPRLDPPPTGAAEGILQMEVQADPTRQQRRAADQVRMAYQLKVQVALGEESLGETTVLVSPGAVPDLRLRAERVIVAAGETVTVRALRGPDFQGELPQEGCAIPVLRGETPVATLTWNAEEHTAVGELPAALPDGRPLWGLLTVNMGPEQGLSKSASTRLWVLRQGELALDLRATPARARPGDTVHFDLVTTAGDSPVAAAVTLLGVDEALGQLATLPGTGDLLRVTQVADDSRRAFGDMSARALLEGRVRGQNALQATLLRVRDLPRAQVREAAVSTRGETHFLPEDALIPAFYDLLAQVHRQVAAWEERAPADDMLTTERMWTLWEQALTTQQTSAGGVDAYGLALHLWRLPPDLLAFTDPRLLATDATRLPEDVENWMDYVQTRAPRAWKEGR